MWNWLLSVTGSNNTTGAAYGFLSGFGSIILPPMLNAAWIIPAFWYHHNCHEKGCLRLGKHPHKHLKFCRIHSEQYLRKVKDWN